MEACQIKILGSGSSGNSLTISDSRGKYIFVDTGIKYDKMMEAVAYNIGDCVLALCSHRHNDHARSLSKLIDRGIPCYSNEDVCSRYKGCLLTPKRLELDGFVISSFALSHDVENSAFVIDTIDGIRILYCTDTVRIPKKVPNVNVAIIESNWDAGQMFDMVLEGGRIESQFNNHQSLDECIRYLKAIDNTSIHTIVLWHLSNSHMSAQVAYDRVKSEFPDKTIYIAKPGLAIFMAKKTP